MSICRISIISLVQSPLDFESFKNANWKMPQDTIQKEKPGVSMCAPKFIPKPIRDSLALCIIKATLEHLIGDQLGRLVDDLGR